MVKIIKKIYKFCENIVKNPDYELSKISKNHYNTVYIQNKT